MALLSYLGLLLFVVSAVKSDVNSLEKWESKDVVREKLQNKLTGIRSHENEVTDQTALNQVRKGDLSVSKNDKGNGKQDYPLALSDRPPCPNFSAVMTRMKTAVHDLANFGKDFLAIFTDVFNNPENSCQISINIISTLKCLLRGFAAGYKQISLVFLEATALKGDIENLITDYHKYSTKCNSNWSLGNTLQLIELLKNIEGQFIKDLNL